MLPFYRNSYLAKNSTAYMLYTLWQSAQGKDKQEAQKKLDAHMKELEKKYEG